MLILALDTSGDICSLNLSEDDRELTTLNFRHERHLSERLSPFLDTLLRDRGVTLRDVDAIAVGVGPGSFTGVRVGVTLAKTLAFALEKPVVGVSSLDVLVEPYIALTSGGLVAVTPTRRGESILACYRPGEHQPVDPPAVVAHRELLAWARATLGGAEPVALMGENAATLAAEIGATGSLKTLLVSPSAASVARLAYPRILRADYDDTDGLVPLYVAPTPVG